jgi:hypothetical protein
MCSSLINHSDFNTIIAANVIPKIPIKDDQVSAATYPATTLNLPCQATCHSIQQSAEENERFAS